MNAAEIKQHLVEIIDSMPENKLEALLDFASYLKEKGRAEDFLTMQRGSKAYQDWLSSENDIYGQVFHVAVRH